MAEKKEFNQAAYKREWAKENMKSIKASFPSDVVDNFRRACSMLGESQRAVLRRAIDEEVEKFKSIESNVRGEVEWATESRERYDLETYLPTEGDYDSEVNDFIERLDNAKGDDEEYSQTVEELIEYYIINYDAYEGKF